MAELQSECIHLVDEAEVFGLGPYSGDHVCRVAGPHELDGVVHPLAGLLKRISLRLGSPPDHERSVVAGPVAVEGMDDVEIGLVSRADHSV